jgi:NAD(P)-dependent dehydrogenase (short-subunit alcohol dehydrogenase family)
VVDHRWSDRVVVVTGASSGIGRATVERLAALGATTVAVARRAAALEELATGLNGQPGQVVPAPLDVTDPAAVDDLAEDVVGRFGRLDAWVNNAAVHLFGRFEETPYADWRRVVDTNLFGYVHGARAALPYFREQGHGALVNVGSMLSTVPAPLQSAYVTSKFAIKGLTDCLRQELQDAPDVTVTLVLPGPIDTPLFQSAGNHTGHRVQAASPTIDATRVADAIVSALERPRREVPIGLTTTRPVMAARKLLPGTTERLGVGPMIASHLTDEPQAPSSGNLHEPLDDVPAEVSGGWQADGEIRRARLLPGVALGAAAAAVAVARSRARS